MKCKIIQSSSVLSLEEEINEWLQTDKYEIFNVIQSQNNVYITVTIFYYDKNEIRKKKIERLNDN